jgi:glutaredoxin
MLKKSKKQTKFSKTGFYFDDCPICQAMKKAEDAGKNLSLLELKKAFARVDRKTGSNYDAKLRFRQN